MCNAMKSRTHDSRRQRNEKDEKGQVSKRRENQPRSTEHFFSLIFFVIVMGERRRKKRVKYRCKVKSKHEAVL